MSLPRHLPLPTDCWVRLLLPAALIFFAAGTDRNYQTDLWHHLTRGRAIVEAGAMVDVDQSTYTVAGQPLRDINWAWQVAFYWLWQLGGLPLLVTVNAALLAVTMALLVNLAWRRSGSLFSAMTAGLFTFFGLWQLLLVRPQTLSLLLFVLLLTVLDAAERNRRWLLVAPALMVVWVNVHGAFPIGVVLIGVYGFAHLATWAIHSDRSESPGVVPWLACLAASAAATLVNPYGWDVRYFVLQTADRASARRIDEWLPPSPDQLTGLVWVLSLVALLLLFTFARRRPTISEVLVLCTLLPLASRSVRMVAWWLLACAPVLAAQLASLVPRWRDDENADARPTVAAALTCLALLAAMLLGTPYFERFNPALRAPGRAHRTETDLQAVADELAAGNRNGRIFTRFSWGEYFGWALAGRYPVFMDGRIDIIPDPVWAHYNAITRGRADWDELLMRYGVTHLVLDDSSGYDAELIPLVRRSPHWREVKRQGDAVLFERRNTITAPR